MSMQIIGLTGGIASGKSTVAKMLRSLGEEVLDADVIYTQLIEPLPNGPSPLLTAIGEEFDNVIDDAHRLKRGSLAQQVFTNPQALNRLGAITHPAVATEVARLCAQRAAQGIARIIYDVPLLFENNMQHAMAQTVLVWVPAAVQVERLMARNGLIQKDAQTRIDAQMSLDQKRNLATLIIENHGDLTTTQQQVEQLWKRGFRAHGMQH